MNRMKMIVAGIGAAVLASWGLFGQTAPPPAFEVASIKPAVPPEGGRMISGTRTDAGRVTLTYMTLKSVLPLAYNVKTYQIAGPAWLDTERFDIVAKVPDGVPKEQIPAMLQALLAERFHMTVHRETREQPVYAIVVGKTGPKLKKYDESAAPVFGGPGGGAPPPPPPPGGGVIAGSQSAGGGVAGGMAARPTGAAGPGRPMSKGRMGISMNVNGATHVQATGVTLSGLASMLSGFMDRPVVDMTGIQGEYDISLEAAADEMVGMKMTVVGGPGPMARASADGAPAPETAPTASVFTSIQQLGLKLEPRKAPIEYVVVDKAEKVPTEN
jgi:uncharacterized protein (TIGR03435 family)